jgi:hypothetical protein
MLGLFPPFALAQNFSPYFETTGEGAYDIYNDAVLCTVVLEFQAEAIPDGDERKRLHDDANDARNFALHMLESGQVVDVTGAMLAADNLPIDLRNARFDWQVVLLSLEDENKNSDAEVARCRRLYDAG